MANTNNLTFQKTESALPADFAVLLHAISSCSGLSVKQLVDGNPKLVGLKGWNGQTPLHRACLTGDAPIVRLLLDHGADPNAVNDHDETPVHFASKRGAPLLVHVLEKYGGKLDVKDKRGMTPVHCAAQTGNVYMLQYLENRGLNFQELDSNLQSCLHHVCSLGHLDAFKFLMRKGRSDPALKDKDGNTPLHICVREGYAHGSWVLINTIGLTAIHVKNHEGYSPAELIKQFEFSNKDGHKQLAQIFGLMSKLPTNAPIVGPRREWWYLLLMPAVFYGLAVIISRHFFPRRQGYLVVLMLAFIIRFAMKSSHRLFHTSRWASPLYAGLFAAGMLHTMLVYYIHIAPFTSKVLYSTSVLFTGLQLYLYWKLLQVDPGVMTMSIMNKSTGQPVTLLELCETGESLTLYCTECELVRTRDTKHCKLCDKCYYRMDHHCLFLLKCVAENNHTRFVWFLICTSLVMAMFVLQVVLYARLNYPDFPFSAVLVEMFNEDCWPLSMAVLNIASTVWALSLVKFQISVIAKGQTTYFQQRISTLTPAEQFVNVVNFLLGKPIFASDFELGAKQNSALNYERPNGSYMQTV